MTDKVSIFNFNDKTLKGQMDDIYRDWGSELSRNYENEM